MELRRVDCFDVGADEDASFTSIESFIYPLHLGSDSDQNQSLDIHQFHSHQCHILRHVPYFPYFNSDEVVFFVFEW